MKRETENKFSARSQESVLREKELRGDLDYLESVIRGHEKNIAKLEEEKSRTTKGLSSLKSSIPALSLNALVRELVIQREVLASHQAERTRLLAEIEELKPGASQLQARTEQQELLTNLVSERLEKDRQADKLLATLRGVLQERAKLTGRIGEACSAIEFAADLDKSRFEELLGSLPVDLAGAGESWANRFFGRQNDAKQYVVRDEWLVIQESLANHGCYRFGETIELTEEQARELLRVDRPAPRPAEPWRCAPQSVMTVEAFEAVTASAEKEGVPAFDVINYENWERNESFKAQHMARHGKVTAAAR